MLCYNMSKYDYFMPFFCDIKTPGHQEGERSNTYNLLQSHQEKGSTVDHLQYVPSSDRGHPNHSNARLCSF